MLQTATFIAVFIASILFIVIVISCIRTLRSVRRLAEQLGKAAGEFLTGRSFWKTFSYFFSKKSSNRMRNATGYLREFIGHDEKPNTLVVTPKIFSC